MIDRIIVPLDGSQVSHAALPIARGMASRTGAAVTLLSVVDPPRDFYVLPQDSSPTRLRPRDVDRLAGEDARLQEYLTNVAATFPEQRVGTEVRLGNPVEQILSEAERGRNSAVVMASHGRSGLSRVLMGSVASRVVNGANVPVILVRASEDSKAEHGTAEINSVVIPLDGSLTAEQAIAAVRSTFGNIVRLHLARVIDPVSPGHAYAPETVAEYERTAREGAEDYLRRKAEELQDHGITVTWEMRGDAPAAGISAIANQIQTDLIAMTTHGRSGIGRFMLGSVAERVLHDADRPVMMIRAADVEERDDRDAPPLV